MEFNNCDIHDNTIIDKAVVLPNGQVIRADGVHNPSPINHKPSPRTRKKSAPRVVQDTFRYRWMEHKDGQLRLVKLYQLLIDERFRLLDPSVSPEDWVALFMGEAKPFTMKWRGKQAHLRYLFKLLLQKKYITYDKASAKHWEIVGSHFVDTKSKPFADWDSQHDPKRGTRTLEMFAEVLNIATTMPTIDTDYADIQDELDAFAESYSSYS